MRCHSFCIGAPNISVKRTGILGVCFKSSDPRFWNAVAEQLGAHVCCCSGIFTDWAGHSLSLRDESLTYHSSGQSKTQPGPTQSLSFPEPSPRAVTRQGFPKCWTTQTIPINAHTLIGWYEVRWNWEMCFYNMWSWCFFPSCLKTKVIDFWQSAKMWKIYKKTSL